MRKPTPTEKNNNVGTVDYLLVLGYKLQKNQIMDILALRLQAACDFYRKHPDTRIILSGGKTDGNTVSEAEAMKQYLMARGIPEEIMVLEEQSRDTYENLVNCRKIMAVMNEENSRENGNIAGTGNAAASRIAIVTSSYHMKRTMRCVRKLGMTDVVAIPAKTPPAKLLRAYLWEALCWLDFLRKGY